MGKRRGTGGTSVCPLEPGRVGKLGMGKEREEGMHRYDRALTELKDGKGARYLGMPVIWDRVRCVQIQEGPW